MLNSRLDCGRVGVVLELFHEKEPKSTALTRRHLQVSRTPVADVLSSLPVVKRSKAVTPPSKMQGSRQRLRATYGQFLVGARLAGAETS